MNRWRIAPIVLATLGALFAPTASGALEIRPFMIYFSSNSSEISIPGRSVVQEAVWWFESDACNSPIFVRAHADTRGNSRYNLELSKVRGETVIRALLAAGIAEERITFEYFGETRPAVATGDSVNEPLNRRVEVDFDLVSNEGCPPFRARRLDDLPPKPSSD